LDVHLTEQESLQSGCLDGRFAEGKKQGIDSG
jgi:hypothetical protein